MSHLQNPKGSTLQQLDPVRRQYQEPRHKRWNTDRKEITLIAAENKLGKRNIEATHHCNLSIVELCHEYCNVHRSKILEQKTKYKQNKLRSTALREASHCPTEELHIQGDGEILFIYLLTCLLINNICFEL